MSGDFFSFWDSITGGLRKLTWVDLIAALESVFNGVYQVIGTYLTSLTATSPIVVGGTASAPTLTLASVPFKNVSTSLRLSLGTAAYSASSSFLGASAQAVDSNKLNGQLASYYQTALGFTPMKTDYSNAGSAPTWNQNTTGAAANLSGTPTLPSGTTLVGAVLGTPTSGNLANCTFPTLNQSTTGSAATLTTARTINGVSFNGSANIQTTTASTSDYSTGTYTPAVTFGGATTGITYTLQQGYYTKIGNQCCFNAIVQLANKGSATGSMALLLPFPSASNTNNYTSFPVYLDVFTGLSGSNQNSTMPGTSAVLLYSSGTGTSTAITNTNATNTSILLTNGCYKFQ